MIAILDYDCVRFENVTTKTVPPRAVCVRMVEDSDIYLLLLGEFYGDPMPGTDMAPTEEEWTVARRFGKPTVVFKREGIVPEPPQEAFIGRVEAFESGAWRGTFSDIPDLLRQLKGALVEPLPLYSPWFRVR